MKPRPKLLTLTLDIAPLADAIADEVGRELLAGYVGEEPAPKRSGAFAALADAVSCRLFADFLDGFTSEEGLQFGDRVADGAGVAGPACADGAHVAEPALALLVERFVDAIGEALADGQVGHGDSSGSRGAESPDEATVEASGCRCGDSRTGTTDGPAARLTP